MPAQRWGEGGAVTWFASKFSSLPAETALPCMLELLTVLPQVKRTICMCMCMCQRLQGGRLARAQAAHG